MTPAATRICKGPVVKRMAAGEARRSAGRVPGRRADPQHALVWLSVFGVVRGLTGACRGRAMQPRFLAWAPSSEGFGEGAANLPASLFAIFVCARAGACQLRTRWF